MVTFNNTPESKILDAGNILILSNLQKPWTIACKDISRVFEIDIILLTDQSYVNVHSQLVTIC